MGSLSERTETTEYAKEKINLFIEKREYHLALLIAHIYIGIRLNSLLIDWVTESRKQQTEDNWKKIATVFKDIGFDASLRNCKNLNLLKEGEYEQLRELQGRRNHAAHESRLWRKQPPLSEVKEIKSNLDAAIKFLERTQ